MTVVVAAVVVIVVVVAIVAVAVVVVVVVAVQVDIRMGAALQLAKEAIRLDEAQAVLNIDGDIPSSGQGVAPF